MPSLFRKKNAKKNSTSSKNSSKSSKGKGKKGFSNKNSSHKNHKSGKSSSKIKCDVANNVDCPQNSCVPYQTMEAFCAPRVEPCMQCPANMKEKSVRNAIQKCGFYLIENLEQRLIKDFYEDLNPCDFKSKNKALRESSYSTCSMRKHNKKKCKKSYSNSEMSRNNKGTKYEKRKRRNRDEHRSVKPVIPIVKTKKEKELKVGRRNKRDKANQFDSFYESILHAADGRKQLSEQELEDLVFNDREKDKGRYIFGTKVAHEIDQEKLDYLSKVILGFISKEKHPDLPKKKKFRLENLMSRIKNKSRFFNRKNDKENHYNKLMAKNIKNRMSLASILSDPYFQDSRERTEAIENMGHIKSIYFPQKAETVFQNVHDQRQKRNSSIQTEVEKFITDKRAGKMVALPPKVNPFFQDYKSKSPIEHNSLIQPDSSEIIENAQQALKLLSKKLLKKNKFSHQFNKDKLYDVNYNSHSTKLKEDKKNNIRHNQNWIGEENIDAPSSMKESPYNLHDRNKALNHISPRNKSKDNRTNKLKVRDANMDQSFSSSYGHLSQSSFENEKPYEIRNRSRRVWANKAKNEDTDISENSFSTQDNSFESPIEDAKFYDSFHKSDAVQPKKKPKEDKRSNGNLLIKPKELSQFSSANKKKKYDIRSNPLMQRYANDIKKQMKKTVNMPRKSKSMGTFSDLKNPQKGLFYIKRDQVSTSLNGNKNETNIQRKQVNDQKNSKRRISSKRGYLDSLLINKPIHEVESKLYHASPNAFDSKTENILVAKRTMDKSSQHEIYEDHQNYSSKREFIESEKSDNGYYNSPVEHESDNNFENAKRKIDYSLEDNRKLLHTIVPKYNSFESFSEDSQLYNTIENSYIDQSNKDGNIDKTNKTADSISKREKSLKEFSSVQAPQGTLNFQTTQFGSLFQDKTLNDANYEWNSTGKSKRESKNNQSPNEEFMEYKEIDTVPSQNDRQKKNEHNEHTFSAPKYNKKNKKECIGEEGNEKDYVTYVLKESSSSRSGNEGCEDEFFSYTHHQKNSKKKSSNKNSSRASSNKNYKNTGKNKDERNKKDRDSKDEKSKNCQKVKLCYSYPDEKDYVYCLDALPQIRKYKVDANYLDFFEKSARFYSPYNYGCACNYNPLASQPLACIVENNVSSNHSTSVDNESNTKFQEPINNGGSNESTSKHYCISITEC